MTLLLAALAGAAMYAAFPDVAFWPAGVVAVALWHAAFRRDHAGWNFLVGLVSGLVFTLPHVRWAYYATETVPWIALALLVALGPALFGAVWTWARRVPWVRDRAVWHALAFATVWTAVEEWRSAVPWGGFPWARLAWSVAGAPTGRAAWLGGTPLVTFLLAAAGALLALVVHHLVRVVRDDTARRAHLAVAATAGAVALLLVLGPAWLPLPRDPDAVAVANPAATDPIDVPDRSVVVDAGTGTQEAGVLRVGLAQGDVAEPGLDDFAHRFQVLRNHLDRTHELADDVAARTARGEADAGLDVILWPENASDLDPARHQDVRDALDAAAREVGAPILVGAQEWPETGGRYNVLLLWQEGEGTVSRYAKQRPVPFGEFIPWRPFFRLLSDQVDRVTTDMLAATNPPLIELPSQRLGRTVTLGVGICFEVAYDDIMRDAVYRGAEILVIPTNNASFGYSAQSTQQLAMSQLQAIATGRATIQVSTVGVSAVIAPDGTIVARTGLFTEDRVAAAVPLRTSLTPAVAAAGWPGGILSAAGGALALAGLAFGIARRRRGV